MADPLYPSTLPFSALVIEVNTGTDGAPVWSAPAGFNTKSFNRTSTTSTGSVVSTDQPDAPALQIVAITAKGKQVTGSGSYTPSDVAIWSAWHESGAPKGVRIRIVGVEYFVGHGVLSAFNVTSAKATEAGLMQYSVTIDPTDAWVRTVGSPTP